MKEALHAIKGGLRRGRQRDGNDAGVGLILGGLDWLPFDRVSGLLFEEEPFAGLNGPGESHLIAVNDCGQMAGPVFSIEKLFRLSRDRTGSA